MSNLESTFGKTNAFGQLVNHLFGTRLEEGRTVLLASLRREDSPQEGTQAAKEVEQEAVGRWATRDREGWTVG